MSSPTISQTSRHIVNSICSFATGTPSRRTLVATAVLWLVVFGLCKDALWRDPHSAYFQDATVYDLGYSTFRRDEARVFIGNADQAIDGSGPGNATRSTPIICAAMATFHRDERQYLNESIGSLLAGLTTEERDALDVRLLFAQSDPGIHPDWNKRWLHVLDTWGGYNLSQDEISRLAQLEKDQDYYTKGVFDYNYLLEECLTTGDSPFIAVFEDDIIFAEGWLLRALSALKELQNTSTSWLYLRLFYTETALGWDASVDYWYARIELTLGLAMSVGLTILVALRVFWRESRRHVDGPTMAVIVFVTIPAFVALVFMAGKLQVMPLKDLARMDHGGCCTQALIFPRSRVPEIILYLKERKLGQTDGLIEEYADKQHLERYAISPQVVQHVGLYSSRHNFLVNTQSVWAFWFETNRPNKLKKEHDRLARLDLLHAFEHPRQV